MPMSTPVSNSKQRAAGGVATARASTGGGRLVLGMLAAVVFGAGAGGGYLTAYVQYEEKIAAITQAAELRVNAKNDRIRELEEQQRESQRQVEQQERELTQQASAQERELIARADERARKLARPDLPVRVWVRRVVGSNALVARVHNFGEKDLVVAVSVHSALNDQRGAWNVDLAPSGTQIIGKEQGWKFAAGDEIDLAANGFRPVSFHVPAQVREQVR